MGYDDNECLSCYCGDGGGGNNPTYLTAFTCMKCIDRITEDDQGNQRVMKAIFGSDQHYGYCQRCRRQECYVFEVPTCEVHPLVAPQPKEEEEEEPDMEEYIEGWEKVGVVKNQLLWAKTMWPKNFEDCKIRGENGEFITPDYFCEDDKLVMRIPGKPGVWEVEWF